MQETYFSILNLIGGDWKKAVIIIVIGCIVFFVVKNLAGKEPKTILDKRYDTEIVGTRTLSSIIMICALIVTCIFIAIGISSLCTTTYDVAKASYNDYKRNTQEIIAEDMGGEENIAYIKESYQSVFSSKRSPKFSKSDF